MPKYIIFYLKRSINFLFNSSNLEKVKCILAVFFETKYVIRNVCGILEFFVRFIIGLYFVQTIVLYFCRMKTGVRNIFNNSSLKTCNFAFLEFLLTKFMSITNFISIMDFAYIIFIMLTKMSLI